MYLHSTTPSPDFPGMNTIPRRPIRRICGVKMPTRHFSYSEIRNTDPRSSSHIHRYNQALSALALDPTYSGLDRGLGGTATGAESLDVTGSTRLSRPAIGSFTCCGLESTPCFFACKVSRVTSSTTSSGDAETVHPVHAYACIYFDPETVAHVLYSVTIAHRCIMHRFPLSPLCNTVYSIRCVSTATSRPEHRHSLCHRGMHDENWSW